MYNMIMTSGGQNWDKESLVMDSSRYLEWTNKEIAEKFSKMTDEVVEHLMGLPTLFAYEAFVQESARFGYVTSVQRRQSEFKITWEFDQAIPPIHPDLLKALYWDLDIDVKWEINRTHWAIKEVQLLDVLKKAGIVATNISSRSKPPKVFISYSWDSEEHKNWVAQLGGALRQRGVDVILDQWHARPGDDLAAFMARSIQDADRVLVVCTERYASKAAGRDGGVGYEHMMVTGQLMRNAGTSKFIPLIRQASPKPVLPIELSTRFGYYFDLTENPGPLTLLDALARELHNMPIPIPPLGPNPFRL